MIRPIYAYGHPVLTKEAAPISKDYPDLGPLIEDMWETMYHAKGIGLAAPQIGLSIRLFLVDTTQLELEDGKEGIKKIFINAEIIQEAGDDWGYEEGCLSIPKVTGMVDRPEQVIIKYLDEDFNEHQDMYDGMNARVVQHEYDHIDGILFTEYLKPLKKRLIKRRLEQIKKGQGDAQYKMKYRPLV